MEKLSRYEQETIIILNREDKEMEVYTSDPYLIKKLEANDEYQKIKSGKREDNQISCFKENWNRRLNFYLEVYKR